MPNGNRFPSWLRASSVFVFLSAQQSNAFVVVPTSLAPPAFKNHVVVPSSSALSFSILPATSSIMTAMEIFDGSTIVDPVVVSDVFWNSLKGKLIAVFIGQVLATIAFGVLSWLVASQISRIGSSFSDAFSNKILDTPTTPQTGTFRKATEIPGFSRPTPNFGKLLICLAIDIVGSSSEVVPILGEFTDIVYAPIAATILRNLYGSNILFGLEFVEEILPLTDILPLATICWVIDTYFSESDVARLLKLGVYSPNYMAEGAIDTKSDRVGDEKLR